MRGIHWSPVNSQQKGQCRGALIFSLICTRINDWVNNHEVGDLRRHCAHYDVTVMSVLTYLQLLLSGYECLTCEREQYLLRSYWRLHAHAYWRCHRACAELELRLIYYWRGSSLIFMQIQPYCSISPQLTRNECEIMLVPSFHNSYTVNMGLLPDMLNFGLRMRRGCRERFPRQRGLTIPVCIMARASCMCHDAYRDR